MQRIPTLDLQELRSGSAASRARFAAELREALCTFGFVVVEGHAVAPELVRRVYAHFERFFASPAEEKLACAGVRGGQRGFTPFGVEHAKDAVVPYAKEFYHVGQPWSADAACVQAAFADEIATYPRNVWPAGAAELRRDSLQMFRALEACAAELLGVLASSFELPRDCFAGMLRGGNSILRALHYPPTRSPHTAA